MNVLKRAVLTVGLSALAATAFAQQNTNAPPPPDAYAKIQTPSMPYPNISWPYGGSVSTSTIPTIDQSSALYLPYLPWIGQNMALMVNYADFFYQLEKNSISAGAYMLPVTALANASFITASTNTLTAATAMTTSDMKNVLSFDNANVVKAASLAGIDGTDITPPSAQKQPNNFSFNADNLMGTLGFDSSEADNVGNIVTFLTGLAQPLPGLGLSTDATTRGQQMKNADVQSYLLQARTLAASQSVALSNFNYLAQEREIVPGLGKQSGMTTLPTDGAQQAVNDASPLQLENFLVNRRVGNSAWYANMNTAPSVAVQRETLFVLAEMQKQLFQLQMVNERMLATMSTMQMQMISFNKGNMAYAQQKIQKGFADAAAAK